MHATAQRFPRKNSQPEPRRNPDPRPAHGLHGLASPRTFLALAGALLVSWLAATGAHANPPARVVSLRADSANGSAHYPVPGNAGPWVNLAGGPSASLENFLGNAANGWTGKGTHTSPYRLYWEGPEQRVVFPAGGIAALQDSTRPVTAALWFKTGFNGAHPGYDYLLDWVQPPSPDGDPELAGKGMSLRLEDLTLQVNQNPWVDAATLVPNSWYHVAVVKAAGDLRVYLNGQRVYTGTHPHMGAQLSPLTIGCSAYRTFEGYAGAQAFGDYFNGSIAQVAIWAGALADGEVAASFAADSALYLPNPPDPPLAKLVSLRADSASGTGRYPSPGASGPWVDLTGHGHNATVQGFAGVDSTSGWAGQGGWGSPCRLEYNRELEVAAIPAGSIPELQELIPTTTQLWFETGPDAESQAYRYLVEWLSGFGSSFGLALATVDGSLAIYRPGLGWWQVAPLGSDTWYQVTVVKRPGQLRVYLDGVPVFTASRVGAGVQGTDIAIGASTWQGPGHFDDRSNGAIGVFTVWQGVMGDAQVRDTFRADSARFIGPPTITASAGEHGAIAPSGRVMVTSGANLTFHMTPNLHCVVTGLAVDGLPVSPDTVYTFTNVRVNHKILATFGIEQHAASVALVGHGTVTRSPEQATYDYASHVDLTATADPAWAFTGWSGNASGTANPLTIVMDGEKAITANFAHVDLAPVAGLLAPNGGEVLVGGNVAALTWSATDDHAVTAVDLEYSVNGGITWGTIASAIANTGSYDWTVPMVPTSLGLVRVTARDSVGQATADVSNAEFSVQAPATLSADSREAVLRLVGCIANPATRNLRVSFSLPDARRARLELLDLSGRRVCSVEVGDLGPGLHVVDLARAGMPPAGIYWVRLAHAERTLLSRVAVIR